MKFRPGLFALTVCVCLTLLLLGYSAYRAKQIEAEEQARASQMLQETLRLQNDYWKRIDKLPD